MASTIGSARLEGGVSEPGALKHLNGPHHQQVAEQDCPGPAESGGITQPAGVSVQGLELAVCGWLAAANVGGIHHVVMDQRAGVQQFKAAGCGDDRVEFVSLGHACRGDVAPGAEAGPDALASAQ